MRTSRPPVIDGKLIDEAWAAADVMADFTQIDPDEGKAATERTEVRVLYDDVALYVGAHLFDGDAARVSRRLSTRDSDGDADRMTVYLDPMHDHATGAMFRVTAANVQTDGVIYNDTWTDWSWDAVWQSSVVADAEGWSVEIRIPLSQLRFPSVERQTWGINLERFIRRKNEYVWLEMVPKSETGLVSRMAHLTGFDGLTPARRLELLPYSAGRAEFITPQRPGNPFNDGSRVFGSAGLDMKWGLTTNLTVDATVNPDFGQVEVDPAVVNLSAFETFFQEKRAFFLEGAQILNNFGRIGSNDFWGFNNSDPQLFYSRRIGRTPQLHADGEFVDPPTATTILGAAKLTGKTSGGWSLGLLEAVTSREMARTSTGVLDGTALVEPLTNYAVVRLQRDIGRRAGVGMLTTMVTRRLRAPVARDVLASQASVIGGDAYLFLDQTKDWVIVGDFAASRLTGTSVAVAELQRAPQRYYQRPDAPHVSFDPSRTSLNGYKGRINLNRNSGLVRVNAALWGVSPGFESNDLGFQTTGDRAGAHGVLFWRNVTPGRIVRSRNVWVSKFWTWNFNRDLQSDGVMGNLSVTFANYWNGSVQAIVNRRSLDDRLTRGGPLALNSGDRGFNGSIGTDGRKPVSIDVNGSYNRSSLLDGWSRTLGLSFNLKPADGVTVTLGPEWNRSRSFAQYVRTVDDPTAIDTFGGRYVFGDIDQWQLSMTTRANVIFGPRVSLQVFMQPLLATGDYAGFKELARPRTLDFLRYGTGASALTVDPQSQIYTADPDGAAGEAPAFTFDNPDYNFKSLRLNAVFRWEMRPGSNFYAVWTRQQQDFSNPGVYSPGRDFRTMFGAPGDDVILFKMAYWIGR